MSNKTATLSFVSEVGTFGSMGIKDPTVVKADLEPVTENSKSDKIRQKALQDYLNNRKDENNEF